MKYGVQSGMGYTVEGKLRNQDERFRGSEPG